MYRFCVAVSLLMGLAGLTRADIKVGSYAWQHKYDGRDYGIPKTNQYGGGYGHLDMSWTWTMENGHDRVRNDWTTVADCLDDNPSWYAGHSGMQYANYAVKRNYPALWARIKAHSDAGRFDGSEMNWSEGYFDFGGDEYYLRNYFISTRFCMDNFGYLPLIAAGFDLDAPCWTQPKIQTYVSGKSAENPTGLGFASRFTWDWSCMMRPNGWSHYRWTSDDGSMVVVGTPGVWSGDGGGAEVCAPSAGRFPTFAAEVFQENVWNTAVPDLWNDHTISAGSGFSLMFWSNKMCENRLLEAEKFATFARPFGYVYPLDGEEYLYEVWGGILRFNQHDVADAQGTPWQVGVSNPDNMNIQDYTTKALRLADSTLTTALSAISSNVNTSGQGAPVIVYNALSWNRTDIVKVNLADIGFSTPVSVTDAAGSVVPSQVIFEDRVDMTGMTTITENRADGGGFAGQYYSDRDLTTLAGTQTDLAIDFDWNAQKPAPVPGNSDYSVRWTGQITATSSGEHTFHAESDDGIRVWVDNTLIIDRWFDQPPTEYTASVNLVQGQICDIRIEYYQGGGGALARFWWTHREGEQSVLSDSVLVFTAGNVPSLGYKEYRVVNSAADVTAGVTGTDGTEIILDNEHTTVRIDKTTGAITSIYDKANAVELLDGPGNRIASTAASPNWWTDCCQFYNHFPNSMPASLAYETPTSVSLVDTGPAVARVKATYAIDGNTWDHYIALHSNSSIVFNRMVTGGLFDNTELVLNLPLSSTVSNGSKEWNAGVAYGHHKYVNKDIYTPTHKWANVANDAKEYSVGLLEDNCAIWSFYGVGGTHDLRLVLIAEQTSRWGGHWSKNDWEMSWGIWGHAGDWTDGAVQKGYEFNSPLIPRVEQPHGGTLPKEYSFITVEPENVVVTAVKKWEDESPTQSDYTTTQMRFYEIDGKNTDAVFRFPASRQVSAWESQGNEYGVYGSQLPVAVEGDMQKLTFPMGHNQIRSLKVQMPYQGTGNVIGGADQFVLQKARGAAEARVFDLKGRKLWQGTDFAALRSALPCLLAPNGVYVVLYLSRDGKLLETRKLCGRGSAVGH